MMHRHARGQALTELLVTSLFLLPLIIGTVWLAKLGATRHALQDANRYALWDGTVRQRASAPLTTDMLVRRVLSAPGLALSQQDRATLTKEHALMPQLSASFTPAPWMVSPTTALAQAHAQTAENVSASVANPVNMVSQYGLDLDKPVLDAVRLEASVATPAMFARELDQPLSMRAGSAVASVAWVPDHLNAAKQTVRRVVPWQVFDNQFMQSLLSVAGIVFSEVAPDSLIFGHVTLEPVPCHRLAKKGVSAC